MKYLLKEGDEVVEEVDAATLSEVERQQKMLDFLNQAGMDENKSAFLVTDEGDEFSLDAAGPFDPADTLPTPPPEEEDPEV